MRVPGLNFFGFSLFYPPSRSPVGVESQLGQWLGWIYSVSSLRSTILFRWLCSIWPFVHPSMDLLMRSFVSPSVASPFHWLSPPIAFRMAVLEPFSKLIERNAQRRLWRSVRHKSAAGVGGSSSRSASMLDPDGSSGESSRSVRLARQTEAVDVHIVVIVVRAAQSRRLT